MRNTAPFETKCITNYSEHIGELLIQLMMQLEGLCKAYMCFILAFKIKSNQCKVIIQNQFCS